MQANTAERIEELKTAGAEQLPLLYRRYFGDKPAPGNRTFLIRQLAYRIQEKASGELSPTAKCKIQELIHTYDPINRTVIRSSTGTTETGRDIRLPTPGSFITKVYKGKRLDVKVLEKGFEYQDTVYSNLSAVAKAVTGAHWNGFVFFGVKNRGRK
ncbi:MAG TPA: DUF2924 domain-containing protein [Candidatus Omnitrophota bacterium]|nr:DUF2924 domain-containing protein [Candidatus Omnitrophota bacterium]